MDTLLTTKKALLWLRTREVSRKKGKIHPQRYLSYSSMLILHSVACLLKIWPQCSPPWKFSHWGYLSSSSDGQLLGGNDCPHHKGPVTSLELDAEICIQCDAGEQNSALCLWWMRPKTSTELWLNVNLVQWAALELRRPFRTSQTKTRSRIPQEFTITLGNGSRGRDEGKTNQFIQESNKKNTSMLLLFLFFHS